MKSTLASGIFRRQVKYLCLVVALATGTAHAQISNGVKLFKGIVSNAKSGVPVNGGRIWIYENASTEPVSNSKINPETGYYQLILNPSTTYRFEFKSPSYHVVSKSVTTPPGNNYEELVQDFKIDAIEIGSTIFTGRLFAPGSTELRATPALQGVVEMLKKEPGIVLSVAVTPDTLAIAPKAKAQASRVKKKGKRGSVEDESPAAEPQISDDELKAIGQARAVAVKNYMKEQSISVTRLDFAVQPGVILKQGASAPDDVTMTVKRIEVEDE